MMNSPSTPLAAASVAETTPATPPAPAPATDGPDQPSGTIPPQDPALATEGESGTVDDGTRIHNSRGPAAASTYSGLQLGLQSVGYRDPALPDETLAKHARQTDAGKQFVRCFPRWQTLHKHLARSALRRLAENEPLDPSDPDIWAGRDSHATAVLRRHGVTKVKVSSLEHRAIAELIGGQREADAGAGLDWSAVYPSRAALDERLRAAHARLPIDLHSPEVWAYMSDKRAALGARLGLEPEQAEDLSRFMLTHPDQFDAAHLRSWRIGSPSWLAPARRELPAPETVTHPVGLFLAPDGRRGWTLSPALSLEMIMLLDELGGHVHRDLASGEIDLDDARRAKLLERVANAPLTGADTANDRKTSASAHAQAASAELGVPVTPGKVSPLDEWGRLQLRKTWGQMFQLQVITRASRTLPRRQLGSRRRTAEGGFTATQSATMELGEAIGIAQDTGLPLLLSTEAVGELEGMIRVGRLKGRPGFISITTAEGMSAQTERLPVDRAIGRLRALRDASRPVQIDGGARVLVRMATVKPLADDTILFPPQQRPAAIMAVGSGLNDSPAGTGKTVQAGRALAHRAVVTTGFRGMLIASGRLLSQWRRALAEGEPGRVAALAPHVSTLLLDDRLPIAPQISAFHCELGDRPGLVMCSQSVLERFQRDLEVINYHLLYVDEGHHYVNPATAAHRALRALRMAAVVDCWLLTATPEGKSVEDVDILLGLAVGDEHMIDSRIASREAGDMVEEANAHRLRVWYGPTMLRVTRASMQPWMPKVLPAKPLPVPPDPALEELFEAIREGGRRAYRNLIRLLADLKRLDQRSDLYTEALAEIGRAQGQVLSNVGVFFDASVDPQTLEHSSAVLAQALVREGVVRPAVLAGGQGEPTLRGVVADTIAKVCRGEQMIVFAERVRCLRQLTDSLGRRGVGAHVAHGGLGDAEFEEVIRGFQDGDFPVLCAAKVAAEGHNLQNASQLLNLDLPWITRPLEQRVGRGDRPGSKRPYLQVWNPYVTTGCIPYIVGVLAPRAAAHHQLLDGFEGVPASESTVAGLLGAITAQVAEAKEEEGFRLTAARLRVAASVFGH